MGDTKVSVARIASMTGAFCAYYMGVAYASGQEMLQFYTAFGSKGLLSVILSVIIFTIFAYNIQTVVNREREVLTEPSDVLMFFLGVKPGVVFSYILILLLTCDCVMKIAGAGAMFEEYFGLPNWVGRLAILLLLTVTILQGLTKLTNIMSVVGPLIIFAMIVVSVISIVKAPLSLQEGSELVDTMDFTKGGSNWITGGMKYVGEVMVNGLTIWIINGRRAKNIREARISVFTSKIALMIACVLMISAQLMNISLIGGTQIPNLILAREYIQSVSAVFSIILLLGLYCSASTNAWYIARQFSQEGSKSYRIFVPVFAAVLFIATSFLSFDKIVNIIYTAVFGLGILLFIVVVVRMAMRVCGSDADKRYLEAIAEYRDKAKK